MADISSQIPRRSIADLCVHVCSIHIDLSSESVNNISHFQNSLLVFSCSGWKSDHIGAQLVFIFLGFWFKIFHIDSPIFAFNCDNLHARQNGTCRIGSMGCFGDQAYFSLVLSVLLKIFSNRQQSSVFSCGATVWLEGNLIELRYWFQIASQFIDDMQISICLVFWDERMQVQFRPGERHHFGGCVQLHRATSQSDHGSI